MPYVKVYPTKKLLNCEGYLANCNCELLRCKIRKSLDNIGFQSWSLDLQASIAFKIMDFYDIQPLSKLRDFSSFF